MTPDTFWNSTLFEINDMIEASVSRERRERRERLIDAFSVAKAIAINISASLAGKEEFVEPWDFYSTLFEEYRETIENAKRQAELERSREKRRKAVAQYNMIRNKKKGGEEDGE